MGEVSFNANDVIDKTLYARKQVTIYRNPDPNDTVVRTVKAGELVGVVDSWIMNNYGLWWGILPYPVTRWVLHKDGLFSIQGLKDQGTKTTEEKVKEAEEKEADANKPWYEKIGDKFVTVAKWGFGGFIVIQAVRMINDSNKK